MPAKPHTAGAAVPVPAAAAITLVVIEDHALVRDAIRSFVADTPDIAVVSEAGTADEGVTHVAAHRPTIALVDINLPGKSWLDAARRIRAHSPETRIVALTAYDYPQYVKAIIELGAFGFLLKSATAAEVVSALRAVGQGETVLDPAIARSIVEAFSEGDTSRHGELTGRELEVLQQVAQGLRNQEIAQRLVVKLPTVETHMKNIFEKLGATNRTRAVQIAQRRGLLAMAEP